MLTLARPGESAQRRAVAGEQLHDRQASLNAGRIIDGGAGSNIGAISSSINARPETTRLSSLQRAANSGPGATHVAQMKAVLEGGSSGVAQMQGWRDRFGDWFKRNIYGPHEHTVSHKAYGGNFFDETEEEATEKVFEGMTKHPAPLSLGRESTEEGRKMLIPFGQILTKTNPEDKSLTNETVPGKHILHPGNVKRTARGQYIETTGTGTGAFPWLNDKMANLVWGAVAHNTRLQIDPEFAEEHYADVVRHMDESENYQ
jgi:hypothetical protein